MNNPFVQVLFIAGLFVVNPVPMILVNDSLAGLAGVWMVWFIFTTPSP